MFNLRALIVLVIAINPCLWYGIKFQLNVLKLENAFVPNNESKREKKPIIEI